jgi:hypothetical protein
MVAAKFLLAGFALGLLVASGCATTPAPAPPWAVSEYHLAPEQFDKAWDAAIAVASKYFEGLDHVNKADRRIESKYYYPNSENARQKVEIRIDPDTNGDGFVVRVRTIIEEIAGTSPPRWVIVGFDDKANDLILEEIWQRARGTSPAPPPKS